MEFLRTFTGVIVSGIAENDVPTYVVVTLLLFAISMLLLIASTAAKAWSEALDLVHIEHEPLSWIESTHPHLPSPKALLTMNLCVLALLVVGLETVRGVAPFNDPLHGLNLVTLFLLAAALGTIGELKWKAARVYAHGFILGTALGFLAVSLFLANPPQPSSLRLIVAICTLFIVAGTWHTLEGGTRTKTMLAAAGVFLLWVLIYAMQR